MFELHPHELRRLEQRRPVLILRPVEPQPEHRGEIHGSPAYFWRNEGLDAGYCHTNREAMERLMAQHCPFGCVGDPLPVDGMPVIRSARVRQFLQFSEVECRLAGVRSYIYPACGDHPDMEGFVTDADGENGAAHQTPKRALAKLLIELYPEVPRKHGSWWWAVTVEKEGPV